MSIYTMRNLLGRFNRNPSVLIAFNRQDKVSETIEAIGDLNIDIRLASNNYNITFFPINLIITDDPNQQIMNTALKLHCPVLVVTEYSINNNYSNLYSCQLSDLKDQIYNLIYKRFILQ